MAVTLKPETAKTLGLAWGFGWRIGAGLLLGYYLDLWMGTSPLWLFVVTLGSFVAGVGEFIRLTRASSSSRKGDAGDPRPPD